MGAKQEAKFACTSCVGRSMEQKGFSRMRHRARRVREPDQLSLTLPSLIWLEQVVRYHRLRDSCLEQVSKVYEVSGRKARSTRKGAAKQGAVAQSYEYEQPVGIWTLGHLEVFWGLLRAKLAKSSGSSRRRVQNSVNPTCHVNYPHQAQLLL